MENMERETDPLLNKDKGHSKVQKMKGIVGEFLQDVVDVTSATSDSVQLLELNMYRSGIPLIAYVTGIFFNRKRK